MSDHPANSRLASITQLIVLANAGDASALDELFTALYGELHDARPCRKLVFID